MKPEVFAPVVISLLKGPVYYEDRWWDALVNRYETEVRSYVGKIGLNLVIAREDGYAFLEQDDAAELPVLIRKLTMNYEQGLLCIVLRQKLEEHDAGDATTTKYFVTQAELISEVESFFKTKNRNVQKVIQIEKIIEQIAAMGFLRLNGKEKDNPNDNQYEVRRIIKAKITPDALATFLQQLRGNTPESPEMI